MDSRNGIPPWSNLHTDLLFNISNRLTTRIELLCFRAVCSSWRSSSVPLPTNSPSLKLPIHGLSNEEMEFYKRDYDHLVLSESTIYSIRPLTLIENSSNTWIFGADESNSGKVVVNAALSRYPFNLYSALFLMNGYADSDIKLPKVLNLLDYKVSEICKAYRFTYPNKDKYVLYDFENGLEIHKVVVSSSFDKIEDGFVAVMIMDMWCKLYVWRIGDVKWTNIIYRSSRQEPEFDRDDFILHNGKFYECNDDPKFYFEDIIFHDGKFYALDSTGLTITVDPKNFHITDVAPAINPSASANILYHPTMRLIESLEDLYLIENLGGCYKGLEDAYEVHLNVNVKIYKLNKAKHEWVKIDRLEDRVLFIGDDISFSCSAKDLDGDSEKGSCACFKLNYDVFIGC